MQTRQTIELRPVTHQCDEAMPRQHLMSKLPIEQRRVEAMPRRRLKNQGRVEAMPRRLLRVGLYIRWDEAMPRLHRVVQSAIRARTALPRQDVIATRDKAMPCRRERRRHYPE